MKLVSTTSKELLLFQERPVNFIYPLPLHMKIPIPARAMLCLRLCWDKACRTEYDKHSSQFSNKYQRRGSKILSY